MGTKNKDSKKKSKKKDKKHKKSKKVPTQDKDSLLEINHDKSKDVPIEVKKQEVDEFMASQLEQLKETMTKLKKREPEKKEEVVPPVVLPEAPVAKKRQLKAYAPNIETQFF